VDAPGAANGWAAGVPGVRVVETSGTRTTLELTSDADDQAVLHAALATGPVREFSRQRPSLTELFRNVVTEEETA
jgi:ABC-2 type transport system ATP-binding protein